MKAIAVIAEEEAIYRILSPLNPLAPGDGPRAPPPEGRLGSPGSVGPRELIYEPGSDDLAWPDPA